MHMHESHDHTMLSVGERAMVKRTIFAYYPNTGHVRLHGILISHPATGHAGLNAKS